MRTIDLYQVHQPNPVVRDGTTMAGCGACSRSAWSSRSASATTRCAAGRTPSAALGAPVLSNQVQYSLAHRAPEDDLLPYAAAQGRLVIAYSPLGQGLLSGRYDAANPPSGSVAG